MPRKQRRQFFVYMLRYAGNKIYTGYTVDLARRLAAHTKGCGAKCVRGKGPLTLVYVRRCSSLSTALKTEYAIKQLSKHEKEAMIRKEAL